MIKRPLNSQFRRPVLDGIKTCTIRKKPWPLHRPIMFYSWTGRPYGRGSRHENLGVIEVQWQMPIVIHHSRSGTITYTHASLDGPRALWEREGFTSPAQTDDWFRRALKPGATVEKWLHGFTLIEARADA